MGAGRSSPSDRVRARLRPVLSPGALAALPSRYQRLGRVLVVHLPEELRPAYAAIGAAWCAELGVSAVLRRGGGATGELRVPDLEVIAGTDTRTEVIEHGVRYGFDASKILFARGNKTERHRIGMLVRAGETVGDLFAGIGYFALPAAVTGRAGRVWAVEKNPESHRWLTENARRNSVQDRVTCVLGDNREADLPRGEFDRVLLGYLPSALPWVERGLSLLRPSGGTLHVHLVVGHREGLGHAEGSVREAVERAGASVSRTSVREVKSYGPGRRHVVVDLEARPGGPG